MANFVTNVLRKTVKCKLLKIDHKLFPLDGAAEARFFWWGIHLNFAAHFGDLLIL